MDVENTKKKREMVRCVVALSFKLYYTPNTFYKTHSHEKIHI